MSKEKRGLSPTAFQAEVKRLHDRYKQDNTGFGKLHDKDIKAIEALLEQLDSINFIEQQFLLASHQEWESVFKEKAREIVLNLLPIIVITLIWFIHDMVNMSSSENALGELLPILMAASIVLALVNSIETIYRGYKANEQVFKEKKAEMENMLADLEEVAYSGRDSEIENEDLLDTYYTPLNLNVEHYTSEAGKNRSADQESS